MKPGNHCTMYSKVPIPTKSIHGILADEEEDSRRRKTLPKWKSFFMYERERRISKYTNITK